MPDITMCIGDGCPIKNLCYRFTAPASERQSYILGVPFDHAEKRCDYFWADKAQAEGAPPWEEIE